MTAGVLTAPFILDLNEPSVFPDPELALSDPDGLLAIGGDLSIERLIAAYKHGIFPWYSEGQPIIWWSPSPRAVLFLDKLKTSKSLRKSLKKDSYHVTFDTAFADIINACASGRRDGTGTWIVDDMKQAYINLHHAGLAHSVEVWHGLELVGGLYGVSLGKAFFGESMFSKQADTSKIALTYLTRQLQEWNFDFIDCQIYSDHLGSLGAEKISRTEFLKLLERSCGDSETLYAHKHQWQCSITKSDLFTNE
ncbi:MAG: leucyl/phenylalanyl-tRNA--protein transferase [Thioalkalispiraceae bacterium]|jgi:leucyl/phenylalanyl-tRNA--protein transferase